MFSPEMMKAAQNMMANMSPEQMAQMYIFYQFVSIWFLIF